MHSLFVEEEHAEGLGLDPPPTTDTHSRQVIALQLGVVGPACNPRTPEMEAENRVYKAEFHSQTLSQTKPKPTAKVIHFTPRIYRRSKVRV